MSAQDRAIQKLARELAGIKKEVVSWRGPQADYTSIENGGNFTFKDSAGNVTGIFGGQDDGSTTVRHVDGPAPMIPAGLTAHVDGPIIQTNWDGAFEDDAAPTFDHSHIEVEATGPGGEKLRGTLNDITGGVVAFTATVSGVWTIVARSVSRAEKRSLDGDAGTVEVEIVGLSGAIEDAIGSANGKNTVTYSGTPPASEDEGIDGDTWFVNSVDPETSIMLITEQWQFLAGAWVQTELDHEVIATIDAGKITVGELDGIRIVGKTVRGEQLSGDAIDGKVITGGTYRTTGGTGSWSDDGLFIAQPDGTSMVRFPTDGSPLSLTASDVQIDRATVTDLDLSYGAVRSGGQFTLASGVTPPASPPELTTGWQKVTSLEPNDSNLAFDWLGLAYWAEGGGHWVRACNYLGAPGADIDAIELFDAVTGEFERSVVLDINPRAGVTVIGDVAYTLGPDKVERPGADKNWVQGFDLNTGERVSRWEFTRFDAPNQAKLAIGNDGTNIVVAGAHMDVSRRLYVMRYNPATGAQVGADIMSDEWVAYTKNVEAVHISGNSMWVSHVEAVREFSLSGSTPTYTNNGWVNPNKNGAGMVWAESRPCVVDGAGNVYRGTSIASDTTVQTCFTWWDGTHETTPSPVAEIVLPAQNELNTTLPVRAGLQKRLYVNIGGWYWSVVDIDQTVVTGLQATGTGAPPTVNTFPNADPATLKSTNDKFVVKGDGSGHWGPLTFNSDGTMTSSSIPAWIPVTTFINGSGANSFGYAPAYRIWPDGKVEWRGIVSFTGTPDGNGEAELIDIPTAARPAQFVFLFGPTNTGGGPRGARIDFSPEGKFRVSSSGTVSWVSLDGVFYYKS